MRAVMHLGKKLTIALILLTINVYSQKQNKQIQPNINNSARQQSQPHLNETLIEPGLFWSENFGSSVNSSTGDKGNQAVTFGWTRTDLSTNGAKPNQWYVSATAPGIDAAGACSQAWPLTAAANMTNRSLHIGKFGSAQEGDEGAFYQATEENITDVRIESPVINTTGMSDLEISFDYYTGGDGQANSLEFYCYDGEAWTLVTTFLPSDPGNCGVDDENTAQNPLTKWIRIQGLVLPESTENNASVKIGFRWKNTANPSTSNVLPIAAAIDNIKIYNKGVVVNNNPNTSTERVFSSTTRDTVDVQVSPERKINFTIYPNPNSGQFTVDFGGIENNFNVELILADQSGNKIYMTEFELRALSDNKFNVIPNGMLKNGRYYCTLIIEGIKYTSIVIIQ